MLNFIVLGIIAGLAIIGIGIKAADAAEIESKVYKYSRYECTKVMVLDKKHTVYEIGDVDNNKAYLYVTGEGALYDIGTLVK